MYRLFSDVMARVGPVHRILADAARSDPSAALLLADIARQRHEGQRRIAHSLALAGVLRPGLREREAADIIDALEHMFYALPHAGAGLPRVQRA